MSASFREQDKETLMFKPGDLAMSLSVAETHQFCITVAAETIAGQEGWNVLWQDGGVYYIHTKRLKKVLITKDLNG